MQKWAVIRNEVGRDRELIGLGGRREGYHKRLKIEAGQVVCRMAAMNCAFRGDCVNCLALMASGWLRGFERFERIEGWERIRGEIAGDRSSSVSRSASLFPQCACSAFNARLPLDLSGWPAARGSHFPSYSYQSFFPIVSRV